MAMSKQDKEQFFKDLEKLDDLSTESEDEVAQVPIPQQSLGTIVETNNETNKRPSTSSDSPADQTVWSKRRRRDVESEIDRPQLRQAKTVPEPSLRDFSSNTRARAKYATEQSARLTTSSPTRLSTARGARRSKALPPAEDPPPRLSSLRRTQSERPRPQKTVKSRGRKQKEEFVPENEHIFKDLIFFFIPNNDSAPVRKRRIKMATARGAVWAQLWSDLVTHVIVDKGLHIDKAVKELPDRRIPANVPILTDDWLVECLSFRDLRDVNGTRFLVPGMKSSVIVAQNLPGTQTGVQNKNLSEQTDLPHSQERQILPLGTTSADDGEVPATPMSDEGEVPGTLPQALEDELSTAINKVKAIGPLPFLEKLLDTESFSSDPGSFQSSAGEGDPNLAGKSHPKENAGFICMEKNDGKKTDSPNARTMEILQEMATYYDQMGDRWRTIAYRKAIAALRKQDKLIRTKDEAFAILGIGKRLADKIEEIVTTDRLQRLESTKANPNDQLLRLFMGVYQVGLSQANAWIVAGYRTLDEVAKKAELTANQKIGIEHYHDFEQRIPREEIMKLGSIVKLELIKADPQLKMAIGGSYRRGKADSGDIDVLITKSNASMEHIRSLIMDTVIPRLTKAGFLKAALATSSRDQGSKWHGACALTDDSPWRRIDLLFVPWDELGAALVYFTGSDIFNRSIRLLASKKGMRLNQHGLYKDAMRGKGRVKITEGELLEGHSERRIFELLGVPYRPPEHRQC